MSQYGYHPQLTSEYIHLRRRKRNNIRRNIFLGFCIVVLGLGAFFTFRIFQSNDKDPEATPLQSIASVMSEQVEVVTESELERLINEVIEGEPGEYAIVVKELEGEGEQVEINSDQEFESASLYKLWLMATVYKQVESGKLSFDHELAGKIEELNTDFDIATESAESTEGDVSGSVENLVERAITVSENYPALLLAKRVGMSQVAAFLKEYDLDDSKTGSPPRTTASDIAEFYEKLYEGEIVSAEASSEMLEILSRQRLNDRIPVPLPENIRVAHKTGELGGYKHDAGIVYAPSGDYILVMLSDTDSQEKAVDVEQEISRVVWEYFEIR